MYNSLYIFRKQNRGISTLTFSAPNIPPKCAKSLEEIFIGRADEIEAIFAEYDNVLNGSVGITIISGAPGIGKTALVRHAVKQLSDNTYIYGKSLQGEKEEMTSVAEIINQTVSHISTLPNKTFSFIREELIKTIGEDMQLLASISAGFRNAFNINTDNSFNDFNKLKYRFKNAILSFVSICSTYLFPLIIHFDDLQWANQFTFDIIKSMLKKKDELNIFLIISFRDNEEQKNIESLSALFKSSRVNIKLNQFDYSHLEDYISRILEGKIANKQQIVRLVNGFSLGNPFFIKENIKILLSEKIITFSDINQEWQLSIDKINSFHISDDMENIFKENLFKEHDKNRSLLELISCLGGNIELEILQAAANLLPKKLNEKIEKLLNSAILLKVTDTGGRDKIVFSHDIIYGIILSSLSQPAAEAYHYDIAEKILISNETKLQSKDLFLTTHLMKSDMQVVKSNASKWIHVIYNAGCYKMETASIERALSMFELCRSILPQCPEIDNAFFVNLHLKFAECLYLSNRHNDSSKILDMLESSIKDKDLKIALKRVQLNICHYNREHKKVISLGSEILKLLGVRFGKAWLLLDFISSRFVYSSKKINNLTYTDSFPDEKISVIFDTLIIMNSSATLSGDNIQASIGLKAALLSAKYSFDSNVFVGYISFAYVLFSIWNDLEKSELMQNKIIELIKLTNHNKNKAMVFFMIGAFLAHWSKPIKQSDYYLQESIKFGEMTGEFLFIGYSVTTSMDTKSFMGTNLDLLLSFIKECRSRFPEVEQYVTSYNYECHSNHILALKNGCDRISYNELGLRYQKLTPFETLTEETLALEKCILFDNFELGYEIVKIVTPKIKLAKGLICKTSVIFDCALIRITAHASLNEFEQKNNLKYIKAHLKELEYLSALNHDNFFAYYSLLKAEYEIKILKSAGAEWYNSSINAAKTQGNFKIAALANLQAANHHKPDNELSQFYAGQAVDCLNQWGAGHISSKVINKYCIKNDLALQPSDLLIEDKINKINISQLIKKTENLNKDDTAKLLLDTVMSFNSTIYCCIICEKMDELFMSHEITAEKKIKTYVNMININHVTSISHKITRYVGRTSQEVYITSSQYNPLFESDPYLKANAEKSIACIPIIYHSVFTGMIYIESSSPLDENSLLSVKSLIPSFVVKHVQIKSMKKAKSDNGRKVILTSRELEILKLVSQGLSNAEICKATNISLSTAKKHLNSIMGKLDADNRIKAVITAKELKII